jgi:hypothetical protein
MMAKNAAMPKGFGGGWDSHIMSRDCYHDKHERVVDADYQKHKGKEMRCSEHA